MRQAEHLNCTQVAELIEPYVDDDLGDEPRSALLAHLGACAACAEDLRQATTTRDELGKLPEFDTPQPVLDAILDGARRERPRRWSRRLKGRPILAAAAALLLGATALWWRMQTQPAEPSQAELARASAEAHFALSLVATVTRSTGDNLRDEVLGQRIVLPTLRGLNRSLSRDPAVTDRGTTPDQGGPT